MSERIGATNQQLYSFSSKIGTDMPIYTKWKGKTFKQIVSAIQKNTTQLNVNNRANNYTAIKNNIFLPQPLKIYRKEIASVPLTAPAIPRTGVSIDEMNRPGGSITVTSYTSPKPTGLDGFVLDAHEAGVSSNTTEYPGVCTNLTSGGLCTEFNARRRVRSCGNMKKSYISNTQQYLNSRNKTFQQNQYNYLVSGNATSDAGGPLAQQNVYSAQGPTFSQMVQNNKSVLSTCQFNAQSRPYRGVAYKPNNYKFATQGAIDSSTRLLQKKLDTMNSNSVLYKKVYGNATASAMGYGVSDTVYTKKDKIGFPQKKTPKFFNYTTTMRACTDNSIS
jgi:hypothetical protein